MTCIVWKFKSNWKCVVLSLWELEQRVTIKRDKITLNECKNLIHSLLQRINDVIEAKGWAAEYLKFNSKKWTNAYWTNAYWRLKNCVKDDWRFSSNISIKSESWIIFYTLISLIEFIWTYERIRMIVKIIRTLFWATVYESIQIYCICIYTYLFIYSFNSRFTHLSIFIFFYITCLKIKININHLLTLTSNFSCIY